MPRFQEVNQQTTTFGENNYVEVTKKRRFVETGKPDSTFFVMSRGFFEKNGETKHWTKFVTLPDVEEVLRFVDEQLIAAADAHKTRSAAASTRMATTA